MESSNHSGITYILTFHSVSIPPFNFTKSESSRADGSDWGHSIIWINYLSRIHDGPHSNCQRLFGHLGQVVIKEARIRNDCVMSKRLDSRPWHEGRPWFVERHVTIRPNSSHKQLYAASFRDLLLILVALIGQIVRISVQNVDILWLNVDMFKKIGPHVVVIAFMVLSWQA